ncbi:CDP-diacylglycerol--serine O-phosphatidyltransferase 1 [Zea mays]|uniref:CDP-diacylglycerol--serine O-phosphatidyltransferase 1 n=1 Tax=Zea mays TaxID=4577 RepID=B4FDM2_MAIZE|nr:unknown [Zea mays]AQK74814.1 CDP-diacylglycerol--serine O-phosphatidyltransferase 1 [Zea mays]
MEGLCPARFMTDSLRCYAAYSMCCLSPTILWVVIYLCSRRNNPEKEWKAPWLGIMFLSGITWVMREAHQWIPLVLC